MYYYNNKVVTVTFSNFINICHKLLAEFRVKLIVTNIYARHLYFYVYSRESYIYMNDTHIPNIINVQKFLLITRLAIDFNIKIKKFNY